MIFRHSKLAGFVFVFVSAVSFGAMPIFARIAYKYNMNTQSILFFRFFIAFLFLACVAWTMKKKFPKGRDLFVLTLMGSIGYAGQSYSYFTALTMIPASLVAILLYLYPVIVTCLSVFFLKEAFNFKTFIALIAAVAGSFLVIGFQPGKNMLGVFWGVAAAFIYSAYIITGARVMRHNDAFSSTVVIMMSATAVYLVMCIKNGFVIPQNVWCWASIIAIAFVSTALAICTFFIGIQLIGAVRSSMLSTFEPVTTVALAAMFLGDTFGLLQILGTLLILISAIILAFKET